MYTQTKYLTASRVLSGYKIALRCHIFNSETFKNTNLVCTWCMCSVYQSYTRFLSYIHLFLVYSWHIAAIFNIPGVYSQLPTVVSQYCKRLKQIREEADALMMQSEFDVPTVKSLMACPISQFIHFVANECGYEGLDTSSLQIGYTHYS